MVKTKIMISILSLILIFVPFSFFSFYFSGFSQVNTRNIIPYLSAGNSMVEEWYRTWGGSGWIWDNGFGVAIDSSNNVYIVGETEDSGVSSRDAF
ncbi:hypothetical protein LCGC14_1720090, partial [marine sediment metagenome]